MLKKYTTKFAPKRDEPYLIQKTVSPTTYCISSLDAPEITLEKYHVSDLVPYKEPEERRP